MPSAVPIFLKMADEKQVIYFTWPNDFILLSLLTVLSGGFREHRGHVPPPPWLSN